MDQDRPTHDLLSPLIPNTQKSIDTASIPIQKRNKKWCELPEEVSLELHKQIKLAGPLVVVSLLQYSLQVISVMFIGHLGEISLSSASMATSFAGVTGFSFMLGMGSALETFCGQAYGAKLYNMLGIYMQRAMVVLTLMCIPIALLWTLTSQIFTLFGQDLEISTHAGIYAKWLIPSIFPYGLLQCQFRFLQTQNIVKPLIAITSLTSLVHLCGCWILVFKLGLGIRGAALSVAISYWFNVLVLGIYIKISPSCKKTWRGLSMESFKGLMSFLSLGVPSALMVCLEFGSYELLVLMSGNLPNPKLETSMMSISLNTTSIVYRFAYGFGSAVSTRVSNELGAGRPDAAKLAVQVVLVLALVEGVHIGVFVYQREGSCGLHGSCNSDPCYFKFHGWNSRRTFRCCKRMWLAEDWCICKSWSLLFCWPPLCSYLNFLLQSRGKGFVDRNHQWKLSSRNLVICNYRPHRLGVSSKEGQG